jgi:putative two-component system response regulator
MEPVQPLLRDTVWRLPKLAHADLTPALGRLAAQLQVELETPSADAALLVSAAYEALKQLPDDRVNSARVASMLSITRYFYRNTRGEACLAPAYDTVVAARGLGDPGHLCKALKLLGLAAARNGDTPAAVAAYAEAIELARDRGDRKQEAALWNSLGVAHQDASLHADAVACFDRATQIAGRDPALRHAREMADTNLAAAALLAGDVARGLQAAERISDLVTEPRDGSQRHARVLREVCYTRLLLQVGLIDYARERARLAQRYAAGTRNERTRQLAAIAAALTDVHCGDTDAGIGQLERVLEDARNVSPSARRDALLALVKAKHTAGRLGAATAHLWELMHLAQQSVGAEIVRHHRAQVERINLGALQGEAGGAPHDRFAALEPHAIVVELHDDPSGEHNFRVGRLAALIAEAAGLDADACAAIDYGARLHDIGKYALPDALLQKQGRLTDDERALMQAHTTAGAQLLTQCADPRLTTARDIVLHHHEHFDGSGYPSQRAGDEIPLAARIVALADVFDAMTHARPYRRASTVDAALEHIAACRGTRFDPALADHLLALVPRLQQEHGHFDGWLAAGARQSPFIAARARIQAMLKDDGSLFDVRR